MHGLSISYPAAWSVQRATQPWTGRLFYFREPVGDFLYDPALTDHLFLALASQKLPNTSAEAWAADLLAQEGCGATESVVIDGAEGLISSDCNMALVSIDDRGYMIMLYISGDDPAVGEVHNRAWFEQILATVELDPAAAAISRPSASSRPGEHSNLTFRVPFTYLLPEEPAFDYGTRNETFWEIRVPEWFEAGRPAGVILQAIGGGRRDPCDPTSRVTPIQNSSGVIDYLQTVKELTVSNEYDLPIGEDPYDPALQAIASRAESSRCKDIWPWMETTEPFVALDAPARVRVVAIQGAGEPLVFTVFGEAENPVWSTYANKLLDSSRFEAR